MKHFLQCLADVLWPRGLKCLCCDAYSEGAPLCPSCAATLKELRLQPHQASSENGHSTFRYEGIAKQLVLLLKKSCAADAAVPLAVHMAEEIRNWQLPADTTVTWVTMPEIRRKKRGIDHGRTLCEAVAAELGLPSRQLLVRTKTPHTQRGLSHDARLKNLRGSIACTATLQGPVLLVDDVMTTGATAALCSHLLLEAGASQVYVMTATRAMLRRM